MARLAFPGVMLLAALLRLWHLNANGFGRQYYAAGVRSMLGSGHALFYNAFDPAGFVSLDKPPLALWLQVASAKLLGFSGLAVLLRQVLEGLAAVALVHHLVGRRFGRGAGLAAALLLALTPIAVAVDRSNNTLGGPAIVAPGSAPQRGLARWIREHGQRVDPALWREASDAATGDGPRRAVAPIQLYDLRPDVAAPPRR